MWDTLRCIYNHLAMWLQIEDTTIYVSLVISVVIYLFGCFSIYEYRYPSTIIMTCPTYQFPCTLFMISVPFIIIGVSVHVRTTPILSVRLQLYPWSMILHEHLFCLRVAYVLVRIVSSFFAFLMTIIVSLNIFARYFPILLELLLQLLKCETLWDVSTIT